MPRHADCATLLLVAVYNGELPWVFTGDPCMVDVCDSQTGYFVGIYPTSASEDWCWHMPGPPRKEKWGKGCATLHDGRSYGSGYGGH